MYGEVRIQLMQVYSQKSTSTTFPRNASAVSGGELTHRCALNDGKLLAALARHEAAITPRHRIGRVSLIKGCSSHEQVLSRQRPRPNSISSWPRRGATRPLTCRPSATEP